MLRETFRTDVVGANPMRPKTLKHGYVIYYLPVVLLIRQCSEQSLACVGL
jgi:hypothetical protein